MISIVVVNYNAGPYLAACLEAVLPWAGQVIVVDNASRDGSLDACAQRFGADARLSLLRNDANLGFARACNQGYALARGESILFLNPDCVLRREAAQELQRVLAADPRAGMAGGLLQNPDGSEQDGGRRTIPTPWLSFVRAFGLTRLGRIWPHRFPDFHLARQPLPECATEVEAISGACMMVKRAAIEDVGLWDEGYFLHCEDLDWCMRFRQHGWKILFVPGAPVTHALGVSSRSRPLFVEWHKHKGMMRFYRKFFRQRYSGLLMLLVGLGVWLRFALLAALLALRRLGRVLGVGHG